MLSLQRLIALLVFLDLLAAGHDDNLLRQTLTPDSHPNVALTLLVAIVTVSVYTQQKSTSF